MREKALAYRRGKKTVCQTVFETLRCSVIGRYRNRTNLWRERFTPPKEQPRSFFRANLSGAKDRGKGADNMEKLQVKVCLFGRCYADDSMAKQVLCENCASTDCVLHENSSLS